MLDAVYLGRVEGGHLSLPQGGDRWSSSVGGPAVAQATAPPAAVRRPLPPTDEGSSARR